MKNQKKKIYLAAGSVLIVGLALSFWLYTLDEESEITTVELGAPEQESADFASDVTEDPATPESERLEPTFAPRNSRVLGENETNRIRQQVVSQEPFPVDVAMDQYKSKVWEEIQSNPPELKDRGSPDIDAEYAYRIYMFYGSCSVAPRTGAELDKRIDQITARTQNATEDYLERVAQSAEQTFDFYELCSAIPADVDARLEAVLWMSQAVYLGHAIAEAQYYDKAKGFMLRPNRFTNGPPIVMLHSGLIDEFKATSRYALTRAVEKGHPEAFLAMSQARLDDIIFPRDPVLAMAYVRVAELEAMENTIIESRIGQQRSRVAPLLTPDQLAEADELAQRIRLGETF